MAGRPMPPARLLQRREGQIMCGMFVDADPELYTSYTRSIRLHGVSTSLRLERMFWDVLAEIGARDSMSVPQLVGKLHDELVTAGADLGNFASFLRVCCLRYLSLQAVGARGDHPFEIAGSRDSHFTFPVNR
jgi:predicted DNA-binding ribbon-helix-helix protein